MGEESGSPQGSADQKIAELERIADDTRNKISAIVAAQRAGRVQMTVATILIVTIILVFGAKTFSKMKSNFSEAKFKVILDEKGDVLLQQAKRALEQTYKEVVPVYRKEARERVATLGPAVLEDFKTLVSDLPYDLRDDIEKRLNDAVERGQEQITEHLQKRFKNLDAEKMATHLEDLKGQLQTHENTLTDRLTEIVVDEKARVKKTMVKFKVQDVTDTEKRELDRQLLKQILLYAIYEVDAVGTDNALQVDKIKESIGL
jgi:hypothetical protein